MENEEPLIDSLHSNHKQSSVSNLSRQQALSSRTSIKLCLFIASSELYKVIGSYAVRYYNDDQFPVDQTFLVTVLELMKALICGLIHFSIYGDSPLADFNFRLLLPSVIYAITNNIFFISLGYLPPAIWMIFVQIRIPLTLLLYKTFFKQKITNAQWIAASMMCFAIALSQLPELSTKMSPALSIGFLLAFVNAIFSASAAVYTELLFKNPQQSNIWKQQCQMYLGGGVFAFFPFVYTRFTTEKDLIESETPSSIWFLVISSFLCTIVHGIGVALLVKKLDNVVKYQVACVVHLLNSGINQILFPDRFSLTPYFAFSLLILFYSIHIYENKTFVIPYFKRKLMFKKQSISQRI